jgi:hypothetical protein
MTLLLHLIEWYPGNFIGIVGVALYAAYRGVRHMVRRRHAS